MMYAILDIETTGGKYNEEGITEIAIYKFDGHEIVDQFISLINPERPIQPFVVNLTGINNNMLQNAPKFYEVAKRIVEITTDCVIVAHNAGFDHRILRTEFRRLGFEYNRKTLCTVELSQKLIPNQESYSLGKLVRNLGIPLSDRHRASGDAQATVKLFQLLLAKDTKKEIISSTIKTGQSKKIEDKLLRLIAQVPAKTGVYYFYREDGVIIYIGKSKNLKKRVRQHFTSDNKKSKQIQKEVTQVTFEITGSELVALLKESEEIKLRRPRYNTSTLSKKRFSKALYHFKDDKGYINLKIDKADGRKSNVTTFTNIQQATAFMERWIDEYELCEKFIELQPIEKHSTNDNTQQNSKNYTSKETPETYNKKVQKLINFYTFSHKNMLIIDRGRNFKEKSVVYIENGKLQGIGFFELNHQIHKPEILKTIITPMEHNRDAKHIIQSYIRQRKKLKIINLNHINE